MKAVPLIILAFAVGVDSIARYSKFRSLPTSIALDFAHFVASIGGAEKLGNNALSHHRAVDTFCGRRAAGCTWAEHHALVDHSREPWAHLYDALQISAGDLQPRASRCERVHQPTPADLLHLVKNSQPAVLTGLIDGWPALRKWTDSYLAKELGDATVAVSVSNGRFDHPETAEEWGLEQSNALQGVIARPAHVPMSLAEALAEVHAGNASITPYIEYLPIDQMRDADENVLKADLRGERGDRQRYETPNAARRQPLATSAADTDFEYDSPSTPVLQARGEEEIGALEIAAWLMPRKQLLWLGAGGTVGSTHFDPYENLMAVISGSKVFHLAAPEEGWQLGAHRMFAEGLLGLESDKDGGRRLVRHRSKVGEPLDLHHYASSSLSAMASSQRVDSNGDAAARSLGAHPSAAAGVNVFNCTAYAGEVVFTPAYWWHEVVSEAPPPKVSGNNDGEGARRSVIAINWFYESYYQRIFPNRSFDRSPHYLMLDDPQRSLTHPFPPPPHTTSRGGDGGDEGESAPSGGGAARPTTRGRRTSFYSRLGGSGANRGGGGNHATSVAAEPSHSPLPSSSLLRGDGVALVPAASYTNATWDIPCEHSAEQLSARIRLHHLQAMGSPVEQTPVFQANKLRTTRECFRGTRCFRAVRDDFVSVEEAVAIWEGIEPHYERAGATDGEKFIGIRPEYVQPAGLFRNVTTRMAAFLEEQMGARNVRVSHTNSRGEWRFTNDLDAGRAAAARRQELVRSGRYNQRKGHIDAARPTSWLFTCLLYVGRHGEDEFAGGETLLIDEVGETDGSVRRGLLVEPRRGRLLAFSSGIENVHTALTATHGYRSLIQVWFTCDDVVVPENNDKAKHPASSESSSAADGGATDAAPRAGSMPGHVAIGVADARRPVASASMRSASD